MQRDGQAADEDDVLALAADRLGEGFEVRLAERLVLDQLDVPVGILLAGRLVHDHLDAGVLGALQHRLERLAVVRDDADHVDLLGDEVLDRAHLLGRIVGRRVDDRWRRRRGPGRPCSTPFSTLSNHGIFTLPTMPILRRVVGGQSAGRRRAPLRRRAPRRLAPECGVIFHALNSSLCPKWTDHS